MTTSIMPRSFMNSACKHRPFKKRLHTVDIQKLEPLIMEVSEPENLSNKPQDLSVRRAESPVSPPPLVISTTPSPPPMASLPTPPPTHHHLFMKPLTTGVLEPLSLNHPMVEPCWPPQQSRTLPMIEQTYTIMPRGNYFGHPDSPNYTGLRVAKRTPVTTLYPPQPPAQRATSLSPLMQSRITYQPIYPSTSSASTFSDSTAELNLLSPSSSSASSASSTEVLGVEDLSRPAKGGKSCSSGQKYSCQACNKTYSSFSGLNKHRMMLCPAEDDQTNNNAALKSFSCKYCEKTYVSLGALKMHIRTHTLPCKCKLCGKAFSRPWLLQGHIRTHTGEKPFSCQHCRRAFADRSNLRAHLQTHSDVKKYSCPNCSKTFSRMSLLGKHLDGGCPGISQHSVDSIIIQQQMQAVH